MGKLVVSEFVTLDGVFEDPGGAEEAEFGGWAFRFERGAEGDEFKLDELRAADALLPKYVISSRPELPERKSSSVIDPGELDERVLELKRVAGG